MAGTVDHHSICGLDDPRPDQFKKTGKGYSSGRLGGNAFHFGENMHGSESILIAHTLKDTMGFINLLTQHNISSAWITGRQGLNAGLRGKDRFGRFKSLSPAFHHRSTAFGL